MTVAVEPEAVLDLGEMIDWQPRRLLLKYWHWGRFETMSPLSVLLTDIAPLSPLKQLT